MSRSEVFGPPCVGVIYLVSDAVQKLITPKQHSHPQWPKNIHHAHLQPSGANTCSRSRSFINRASSSHLLCILRESKRLFGERICESRNHLYFIRHIELHDSLDVKLESEQSVSK